VVQLGTVLKPVHLCSQGRGSGCFQAEVLELIVLAENENKYSNFFFLSPCKHLLAIKDLELSNLQV